MVRPILALRLLVALTLLLTSCWLQADFPVTLYLDDKFGPIQERDFVKRLDEANRVFGQELLGIPAIFTYGGRHKDPDGFRPDDFRDGKRVVYAVTDLKNPSYLEFLRARNDPTLHSHAYTTHADVVIWMPHIENADHLAHIFSHEPMHLLYLGHTQDPESVMYSDPIRKARAIHYNETDRKLFCSIYPCKRKFPAP